MKKQTGDNEKPIKILRRELECQHCEKLRNLLGYTELELEEKNKEIENLKQQIRDIKNSVESLTRNI